MSILKHRGTSNIRACIHQSITFVKFSPVLFGAFFSVHILFPLDARAGSCDDAVWCGEEGNYAYELCTNGDYDANDRICNDALFPFWQICQEFENDCHINGNIKWVM